MKGEGVQTETIQAFSASVDWVNGLYDKLLATKRVACGASEAEIEAKQTYERLFQQGITNGTVLGSNDKLRELSGQAVLAGEYQTKVATAETARKATLEIGLAQLELDRYHDLIHLAELFREDGLKVLPLKREEVEK
jgi:hypothetical protein